MWSCCAHTLFTSGRGCAKAAGKQSLPLARQDLTKYGPLGLDQGPTGGTNMGYEAPAALRDFNAVIDSADPSRLHAGAVLHSHGIRTTVAECQEHEPEIEPFRAYQ